MGRQISRRKNGFTLFHDAILCMNRQIHILQKWAWAGCGSEMTATPPAA